MTTSYVCTPKLLTGRKANYEGAKAITDNWEPISSEGHDLCGNIRPSWDKEAKKFIFLTKAQEKTTNFWEKYPGMYYIISSAFLLYRLLCLFRADVLSQGPDGYKCIWWITLRHKETNEILMFGEWKGAAGIWTRFHNHHELPKTFKKDTLDILNLLVSNTCPHPYDGLVAGAVA